MTSHGLRDQDRLDGASNNVIWKTRILVVLEEYDLEDYVKSVVGQRSKEEVQSQAGEGKEAHSRWSSRSCGLTLAGQGYISRDVRSLVFLV